MISTLLLDVNVMSLGATSLEGVNVVLKGFCSFCESGLQNKQAWLWNLSGFLSLHMTILLTAVFHPTSLPCCEAKQDPLILDFDPSKLLAK